MDPNPLLSTTATAAAALVAIVGGLLVSRVISLATEQSGLNQRLHDLRARQESAQKRSADLKDKLLRWDANLVLAEGGEQFARCDDNLDVQRMIDEAEVDRQVAEMRTFVEAEAQHYKAIRAQLEVLFEEGYPGGTLDDLCDAGLLDVRGDDNYAYMLVWDELGRQYPRPSARQHAGYSHRRHCGASTWPATPRKRPRMRH